MRRLCYVLVALLAACSSSTDTPPDALLAEPLDGTWTWSGSGFRLQDIEVVLSEEAGTQALSGNWTGHLANCSTNCEQHGVLVDGTRSESTVHFQVSATNSIYSITFDGTEHTGPRLVVSGRIFEQGYQPAQDFVFHKQ